MDHKYLKELPGDGNTFWPYNEPDYPAPDKNYGFDTRETFSFDNFMITWLYERLRFFQEYVSERIDLDYHTFRIHDEVLTQSECIERMIQYCKVYIEDNEDDNKVDEMIFEDMKQKAVEELFYILGKVFPAMWW